MKKTTVALALAVTLGTALTASPQTPRPGTGRCGFRLLVYVLDLQEDIGTATSAPTYNVMPVVEPTVYFDQIVAAQRARIIATDGILGNAGRTYYPAHRIQKIAYAPECN